MFKVPDWGEDVPNMKVNFDKKTKKGNKQQTTNPVKINKAKQTENNTSKPKNGIKKKKRKNKQINTSADTSTKPNVKANAPSFVSTKINGAVKNKFKKKLSVENKKENSNNINNVNKQKIKIKHSKNSNFKNIHNKKPETDYTDGDKSLSSDSHNLPKKGKKRKKPKNNEGKNLDNGMLNEEIKAKKKKLDDNINDQEDLLFGHNNKSKIKTKSKNDTVEIKVKSKKERLKQLLETQMQRTPIKTCGNKLRDRMLERLKAAQFRYINEKLYTSSGSDAQQLFQNDPTAFHTYHEGYQQQVKKWPVNPLDLIVKRIQKMPKTHKIADMGCGEGALSKRIQHTVRSFDLVASSPGVEVCDIAHTPLLSESMDVAVYCLALMGTDLTQYLVEANRVLKVGGFLLIAEVESRFNKVDDFTKDVERLGFKLKNLDKTHQVFFFIEFTKIRDPPVKKSKLPVLALKPCLYKRR